MKTCNVDGCDNVLIARGWCHKHYKRWQTHGDPLVILARNINHIPAFEALINKNILNNDLSNQCWNWDKKINLAGYGAVSYLGKKTTTHRASYKYVHGDIPTGLCVCHHCDNRICFNPSHLFLGTAKDNAQDCVNKDRKWTKKGEASHYAKLQSLDVIEIRKFIAIGMKNTEIALLFNVSHGNISSIRLNKTWKHLK